MRDNFEKINERIIEIGLFDSLRLLYGLVNITADIIIADCGGCTGLPGARDRIREELYGFALRIIGMIGRM